MARPEVVFIRCYRKSYGDVQVKDVPFPCHTLEEAKQVTRDRLLNFFLSDQFRPGAQPHTADLIGEDDRIIGRYQVRPKSSGGHEIVEVQIANRT